MKSIFQNHLKQYLLIPVVLTLLTPGFATAMKIRPLQDKILVQVTDRDGKETEMEILGFSHEVVSPRDAGSGLPTGKRQHKPVNITKIVDASSHRLTELLISEETLPIITLLTIGRTGNGHTHIKKTLQLEGVSVCGVRNMLSAGDDRETEQISLCYQKVVWTWHDGDDTKSAEDKW